MRELTEQELVRRNKLLEISKVTNPYPERFEATHSLKDASKLKDEEAGISIAGRIVLMRKMGKLTFLTVNNAEGRLQLSIKKDLVGEEAYKFFADSFDLGDYIGATGEMFTTHTGEKTLRADSYIFLGKALRPLPEKFHGLTDVEACYRERYVDLITNDETKKRFLMRSKLIKEMRDYLNGEEFIEIETPVLSNKASGASARPFSAHHNALDIDVFLRIAPETYLKRAVVGGFDRVFEFARCFRNEGIDATHLQDFTMVEGYAAYYNFEDSMNLMENMFKKVINDVFGKLTITIGENEINLDKEWPRVSFKNLLLKDCDIDIDVFNTAESLLSEIKNKNIDLESETPLEDLGFGNLVDQLYKKVSRPMMLGPVFLVDHPISLSPLARANDDNKQITDRFQLVINGAEIVNAYSELVDPIEQRNRLLEQAKLNDDGDADAMVMDDDYIGAMEYGMPPISGWGIGIDRLMQVLTGSDNIKDVVLFPLMRPQNKED